MHCTGGSDRSACALLPLIIDGGVRDASVLPELFKVDDAAQARAITDERVLRAR